MKKSLATRDYSHLKTNLSVSPTEFCQAIFEERDIRAGLGGGSGHRSMIPLQYQLMRGIYIEDHAHPFFFFAHALISMGGILVV